MRSEWSVAGPGPDPLRSVRPDFGLRCKSHYEGVTVLPHTELTSLSVGHSKISFPDPRQERTRIECHPLVPIQTCPGWRTLRKKSNKVQV